MTSLLATTVVSELRKVRSGKADAQVARWAEGLQVADLFISVITVQELEIGVRQVERRDDKQGQILRDWLDHHVLPAFAGRILAVYRAVAQCSAQWHVPDPRPFRDGLIAATAKVHHMTVVTRNTADFSGIGVNLLNPWLPVAELEH